MSLVSTYKKALQQDEPREAIYAVVENGDAFALQTAILLQDPLPSRDQVDIGVFSLPTHDAVLLAQNPLPPVESIDFDAELAFVQSLVALRDVPLSELDPALPEAYRVVSWFLRDFQQQPYTPGLDYMTTEESYLAVQRGEMPPPPTRMSTARGITTGRDAATYVHTDDPIALWTGVVKELLALGVPKRRPPGNVTQKDFTCFGYIWIAGALGAAARSVGLLCFREKWRRRVLRPEELYYRDTGSFLAQCYPEGSPTHPSNPAGHGAIAWALCQVVLLFFDNHTVLPSGRTVKEECELLASNVAQWRTWAGVHYPIDNVIFRDVATAVAHKVVGRHP